MMVDLRAKLSRTIGFDKWWFREFCAELLGSAMLVAVGNGSVAQVVLSRSANGTFLTINVGYAMAVAFAVYVSGGVSGGHVNPAITLAMCLLGKTKWRQFPVYVLAQYFGCFIGSFFVYAIYHDAINNFDGGVRQTIGHNATAGIFATYPIENISVWTLLLDQMFGTALLSLCVLAITDPRNMAVPKGLVPLAVGLVLLMIGVSFGMNCGYAVNPARDLAPRFFTFVAGWGSSVFSFNNYNWFWVPVVGPHIGAILGSFVYEILIGSHWPSDGSDGGDFPGHNGEITLKSLQVKKSAVTVIPVEVAT